MRTNKDRTCICCGDTIPAGSSRMIPRHAKANHGLCFPCFRKWRDTGGDLKLMNNPGDAKKERTGITCIAILRYLQVIWGRLKWRGLMMKRKMRMFNGNMAWKAIQ